MTHKIAAALIVGDAYDEQEVKNLLDSLKGHIHGIFINYNGKKRKLNWQKWTEIPIKYNKFAWEDDFGLARNQAFSLIPKDEFDWILWIDTDDKLVTHENGLQEMIDSLDEYTEGVFMRYAYAVDPTTEVVVVEQWRERLLSTKVDWNWEFRVHEVAKGPLGTQFAKRDQAYIEHQRKSGEERGARARNRKIISKAMVDFPDEPRYVFYMAGETLAEADSIEPGQEKLELIETSLMLYKKYREMINEVTEDVYLATCRISELCRMKKDYGGAIEADLEAIAIFPDWPDGYVNGAKSCLELRDFRRMKSFADMASKCPKPQTAASIEPLMVDFTPLFLRGIANEELGNLDQALEDYKKARERYNPPNGHLDDKIEELEERILKGDEDEEQEDSRKTLRGTCPDKSICFFTQPIPDVWHPELYKTEGVGGAETCIMKLAPYFEADGWRVVVFGVPGQYRGVYEGVEYWNSDEFLPHEEFSLLVSSRSTIPFQGNLSSKASFLWMHDVNIGPEATAVMNKPDAVIGLTDWHTNHLQKLYGLDSSKIETIPNGVDFSRFPREKWNNEKNYNKLIWSSSPDRGLDTMLGMWPLLRDRYEDLELHIFYGWDMIDKIVEFYKQAGVSYRGTALEQFKNKCVHQIDFLGGEEGGVFQHGRVNQNELADFMMNSAVWPYCTQFLETFCITAVEMQAAGVIPVVSDLAALKETVSPFYERIDGWPSNADYQKRYLQYLAYTLESQEYREEGREKGREWAEQFTWDNSYSVWNDVIKKYI